MKRKSVSTTNLKTIQPMIQAKEEHSTSVQWKNNIIQRVKEI